MIQICRTRDVLMIESRNINIIVDADGNRLVLINDVVFKGKRNVNWDEVKTYLEQYVGDYYEIEETSEKVYIGNKLPDEYTGSESKKILLGANAKAKANAATAIPELIQIAKNPSYQENKKEKHSPLARRSGSGNRRGVCFVALLRPSGAHSLDARHRRPGNLSPAHGTP